MSTHEPADPIVEENFDALAIDMNHLVIMVTPKVLTQQGHLNREVAYHTKPYWVLEHNYSPDEVHMVQPK